MKLLLLGDVHGDWDTMLGTISHCAKSIRFDHIIQVGDFGFYEGMIKRLTNMRVKSNSHIPISFIDGNHENHVYLSKANLKKLESHGLFYQKRMTIKEFDDKTFAFLGGAFNVDRPQENHIVDLEDGHIQKSVTSYPTLNEVSIMIEKLNQLDKPVDIMFTHGCPGGIGVGIKGHPYFVPGVSNFIIKAGYSPINFPITDVGEYPLTVLWEKLKHKPKKWIFGHYHQVHQQTVDGCTFYCIGCCDGSYGQTPFVYDTASDECSVFREGIC